jgi:IS1 family transposase
VNYDDIPEQTLRGIHARYDRAGHVGPGIKEGYAAVNYTDIPDATLRELYEKADRVGVAVHTGNDRSTYAVNYDDVPDATLRELYEKADRAGTVHTGNRSVYAVNYDDVPDTTLREVSCTELVGTRESSAGAKQQGSRHHFTHMQTNASKNDLEINKEPVPVKENVS